MKGMQKIDSEILEKLKVLYSDTFFDDYDSTRDLFFDSILPSYTFFMTDDEKIFRGDTATKMGYNSSREIVSSGYIRQKRARLFDREYNLPMLSALSTKSTHRGKGYIGIIIKEQLQLLYDSGEFFATLSPFDFDYYKRFGFSNISYCKNTKTKMNTSVNFTFYDSFDKLDDSVFDDILELDNQSKQQFTQYYMFDKNALKYHIQELFSFCGKAVAHYQNGKLLCFYVYFNDQIEYYACHNSVKFDKATHKVLKYSNFSVCKEPYLQGRIVNVKKAIESAKFIDSISQTYVWKIKDKIIKENNKVLQVVIKDGRAKVFDIIDDSININNYYTIKEVTDMLINGNFKSVKNQKNFFIEKY